MQDPVLHTISTVASLLNNMFPRPQVNTRHRPLAVWFDGDGHKLRRRTRCMERRFRWTDQGS